MASIQNSKGDSIILSYSRGVFLKWKIFNKYAIYEMTNVNNEMY